MLHFWSVRKYIERSENSLKIIRLLDVVKVLERRQEQGFSESLRPKEHQNTSVFLDLFDVPGFVSIEKPPGHQLLEIRMRIHRETRNVWPLWWVQVKLRLSLGWNIGRYWRNDS